MAKEKPLGYTEKDIQHLENLEAVRNKPTIYIGPTDSDGIGVCVREPLDNAVDEFLANRNDSVTLIEDSKGYFWVIDQGEGIPVKPHPKSKVSTLEVVVSKLHSSGKYNSTAYKDSRGTHGLGVKGTNAMSEHFVVYTHRDGSWHSLEFKKGVLTQKVKKCETPKLPKIQGVKLHKPTRGTIVKFKIDAPMFTKGSKLNYKDLFSWCQLTAYLNAGFKIRVVSPSGKEKSFYSKKGISEYLEKSVQGLTVSGKMFTHQDKFIDAALYFTNADGIKLEAYTNGLRNKDGGLHVKAMFEALNKAIAPYKGKKEKFTAADFQDGIVGIINVKLPCPKFNNQPKDKLIDDRVPEVCDEALHVAFRDFFAANKSLAKGLCKRAVDMRKLREEFSESKKALKDASAAIRKQEFSPRHVRVDCPSDKRELFLVEGDSAGGTAKFARDRLCQEILPLKGKILNVMRAKPAAAFSSEEVKFILVGIGFDPKNADPLANLRVSKLVMLSDPDPDGGHINTLLLTLIAKFMPDLFEKGIIYMVYSPEYTTVVDGVRYYGSSVADINTKIPKGKKAKDILHIKGWGEVSSEVLEELAFNPNTRKLFQVQGIEQDEMGEFVKLMSENTEYRKQLLGINFDISDATDSEEEENENGKEKAKGNRNGRQLKAKKAAKGSGKEGKAKPKGKRKVKK